eukprot:11701478-Alexandrium_andersonii.AAC.1
MPGGDMGEMPLLPVCACSCAELPSPLPAKAAAAASSRAASVESLGRRAPSVVSATGESCRSSPGGGATTSGARGGCLLYTSPSPRD